MYQGDYDEMMPLSVSGSDQVGSIPAAQNSWQLFGVPAAIEPYVKSPQMFACPSDNGFVKGATINVGGTAVAGVDALKIWQVNGTSYKFNKDSFSQFVSTSTNAQLTPVPARGTARYAKAKKIGPGDGTYTSEVPFPLPDSFFARPAETYILRDYLGPWDLPSGDGNRLNMHDSGAMLAFKDGHVKWFTSKARMESLCDGPTFSPIRNASQPGHNINGDGSCGAERA